MLDIFTVSIVSVVLHEVGCERVASPHGQFLLEQPPPPHGFVTVGLGQMDAMVPLVVEKAPDMALL